MAERTQGAGWDWRQALGMGVLLGLGLGCMWLAAVAGWFAYARALLVTVAAALLLTALGWALSERQGLAWAGIWQRRVESRFTSGGIPFFVTLVVLALAALTSGNNLFYLLVAGLLAALMISGVAGSLDLGGLGLRIRMADEVVAGAAVEVGFTLSNAKRHWPSYLLTVGASSEACGVGAGERAVMEAVFFPYLRAGESASVRSQICFPRRGLYTGAAFTVATRFPFGLVQKRRHFRLEQEGEGREAGVVVHPAAGAIGAASAGGRWWGVGSERLRRGTGQEMWQLRPHQAGDSARSVHWKASARAGALRVREAAEEAHPRLRLRFAVAAGMEPSAAERAVEECAGWVAALVEEREGGGEAWFEFVGENPVAGGRGVYFAAAPASRQRRRVLDYLALVDVAAAPEEGGALTPMPEILVGPAESSVIDE